jgi:hypothetical protein
MKINSTVFAVIAISLVAFVSYYIGVSNQTQKGIRLSDIPEGFVLDTPTDTKLNLEPIDDTPTKTTSFGQDDEIIEPQKDEFGGTIVSEPKQTLYSGIFIGLCALCSFGLIFFLCHKTTKETMLCSKSFLSFLAQWAKQNHLHFSILYILSALICLGWLIFGVICMLLFSGIGDIGGLFRVIFVLALLSLICVAGLWVIYFAVYGFIKLISYKRIICLWIGIVVFIIMGLFPPWITKSGGMFLGYSFLLREFGHIDISRLAVQWIIVAVITGGLFLAFQEKKKD